MVDRANETMAQRETLVSHPLSTIPTQVRAPKEGIPNTPLAAATVSFLLGSVFSLGALTFLIGGFDSNWWSTYQLGFFVAAWAAFHWAEFAVTAGWNLEKCSVDSFLLDNGATYHIANGTALTEYLLTLYFKPSWKAHPYVSIIGIFLVLAGQALRSGAMIHASSNFSHVIEHRKRNAHVLVTNGIYAWFRHPSYAGFYYWALGTQLVLQNPVTFCVFLVLLWRFFYYRTRAEEKLLVKFFGDEYVNYRNRVGTMIPFVP
ncbi:ICMT-domain-containing protein [Hymenopellis radicata]|nr:ICMT-domain-containing protein [Hymenopellis radicata]